jgi:hypothetical protein
MRPKTRLGRWAGGLSAVFLVFLIALILARNLAGILPGTPLLIFLGMGMMTAGIAAFVAGSVSLFKLKDRSFVVILATLLGTVALIFSFMELIEGIINRGIVGR